MTNSDLENHVQQWWKEKGIHIPETFSHYIMMHSVEPFLPISKNYKKHYHESVIFPWMSFTDAKSMDLSACFNMSDAIV